MTTAARRDAWDRTSNVLAAILNSQPGRRRAVKAKELHPFYSKDAKTEQVLEGDITCLMVFLPKNERKRLQKERRNGKRRSN